MARAIGINHVALEVGDVGEALDWYGRFFHFELRGRHPNMAWIDLGDQFLALSSGRRQGPTTAATSASWSTTRRRCARRSPARAWRSRRAAGCASAIPWGNAVEIVDYRDVQFTKAPAILAALAPEGLEKSEAAREELARKGLGG